MTAPSDLHRGPDGARTLAASPTESPLEALAEGVIRALPGPALLVTEGGAILAANGAASALFGAPASALPGTRLAHHLSDEPEAIARYLASCARTRSPIPGALHPRPPAATGSAPVRRRVAGAVARPAGNGAPALILLRFAERSGPSDRFVLLNRQIEELTREVRARRAAEAALLDANARLRERTIEAELANQQLEEQAGELEHQIEAAEMLTDELEAANRSLLRVNEELREQTRAAEMARHEAEDANRAKSDFLAMMSHELRTPLNAIGGYVELLELGIRGPLTESQRDDLARIQRAQRHLLVLITEVLGFARLEAGQVSYAPAAVPVDALLRGIEPLIAPQVQAQQLRYVYAGDAGDAVAWADREKVEQILLNLLSNAVKFTPPGGAVSLASDGDESRVRIRVRDTGIGIPADKLERVFEPFVQLDQSLTRSREGVGLGLAISRDLARGMGGDLTVESAPGAGSTFTLTLPTAA